MGNDPLPFHADFALGAPLGLVVDRRKEEEQEKERERRKVIERYLYGVS